MVSTYLPLLLMGLLAAGTWWLVENTPVIEPQPPAGPARHEPDYTMTQFTVQRFAPEGPLRAQIEGEVVRHYPDTDTLEIDKPRLRAVAPDGQVTVATANQALSNRNGSEVQLMGGAQVVREPGGGQPALEFRGEFLHAFLDTEQVRSHLPVWVQQGGIRIQAEAFDYNHASRVLQAKGRVRATFASPGAGGPP
jgi:lipopolysaccharide export system protein LptC